MVAIGWRLLCRSVFGRLAGYEDVNDAERLCRDPEMRWVVGRPGDRRPYRLSRQMDRFEMNWLSRPQKFAALADLPGQFGNVERYYTLKLRQRASGDGRQALLEPVVALLSLKRPAGRPLYEVRCHLASFGYQVQSWRKPRYVGRNSPSRTDRRAVPRARVAALLEDDGLDRVGSVLT